MEKTLEERITALEDHIRDIFEYFDAQRIQSRKATLKRAFNKLSPLERYVLEIPASILNEISEIKGDSHA